jgi:hypothetical protein
MPSSDDLKDLGQRVAALESTLSGLKIAAIVLGLGAATLAAYVQHVRGVAEQARGQVDGAVAAGKQQLDQHVRTLLPSFGAALDQAACRDVTWRDCDESGWAMCPKGMYVAGVKNAGGTNACVRTLKCCAPAQGTASAAP